MENQQKLFPHLDTDNKPTVLTEKESKDEIARLLEVLMQQGFVNVSQEDISVDHLQGLINTLRD